MIKVIGESGTLSNFDRDRLSAFIDNVCSNFPELEVGKYKDKILRSVESRDEISLSRLTELLTLTALENVSIEQPNWTFVAAKIFLGRLYKEAAKNRGYDKSKKYGSLYNLIRTLVDKGIYTQELLENYTKEEIDIFSREIDPERDNDFNYVGILTLADRYLTKDYDGEIYELPQERYMIIAMTLMMYESSDKRIDLVKEAYWALQYMTVATPTLSNAGKAYGQLSSCFVDTVDDSLRGIYDSNTDIALLSKGGGGIAAYMGKVRPRNSDIRKYKGVCSGTIPWIKQLNNTAVSVDQLGQRQGSIAVYQDVWHKDILGFLDLRLNNGDERLRAHDIFLGVCIPDLFMEKVEERGDWYLFDPHEIKTKMGFSLEDFYDEELGQGSFREMYEDCVNNPKITKEKVPAIEIMKRILKSQLESGMPFMFYRDEVNRKNPNKHAGNIYCANLCTEVTQNMRATTVLTERLDDGVILTEKIPGDFVVCNLSSINLAKAVTDEVLERLIPIQVRMLDNVIDLNKDRIEVLQAVVTNQKYRAIGLGTYGWHHLLALKKIKWESDEAVIYADKLYEKIAYLTIEASMNLAKEKGAYPMYRGSDWDTGDYFTDRGYLYRSYATDVDWANLACKVKKYGIRNGYLMAVAPNGSTALIGGSTASIDPIFAKEYSEEKKDFKVQVTAPGISPETFWFYKSAYDIDQRWSIKQNAARQRHIDQSQSFNLYVRNDIKATEMLDLHLTAWKSGLKTTYYVRSTAVDVEECESCSS